MPRATGNLAGLTGVLEGSGIVAARITDERTPVSSEGLADVWLELAFDDEVVSEQQGLVPPPLDVEMPGKNASCVPAQERASQAVCGAYALLPQVQCSVRVSRIHRDRREVVVAARRLRGVDRERKLDALLDVSDRSS